MTLIVIWLGWTPSTLAPGFEGGQKGILVGFWSLRCAFWRTLYQTKVAGHPQLSGVRSPVWIPNLDLEGPGPSGLLEPWCFIPKESLKHKSCIVGSK